MRPVLSSAVSGIRAAVQFAVLLAFVAVLEPIFRAAVDGHVTLEGGHAWQLLVTGWVPRPVGSVVWGHALYEPSGFTVCPWEEPVTCASVLAISSTLALAPACVASASVTLSCGTIGLDQ